MMKKYVGKIQGFNHIHLDLADRDYAIIPDAFRMLNAEDIPKAKELYVVQFLNAREYGKIIGEEIPMFVFFRKTDGLLSEEEQKEILHLVSCKWDHFKELEEYMTEGSGIPWIGDFIPGIFKVPQIPSATHVYPEDYACGAAVFRRSGKQL